MCLCLLTYTKYNSFLTLSLANRIVFYLSSTPMTKHEPQHAKTNKVTVQPAKTQISLGIRPVWSESSMSAWRKLGSLATHLAQIEYSDQTGRMPRLIWVFAGRTATLLGLSYRGSHQDYKTWQRSTENKGGAWESYKTIWVPSSEFVSSSIPSWQILTAHAQPFRGPGIWLSV